MISTSTCRPGAFATWTQWSTCFRKCPLSEAQHTLANHPDPVYTNMLLGGAVVAGLALLFLLVMSLENKRAAVQQSEGPIFQPVFSAHSSAPAMMMSHTGSLTS